MNGDNELDIDIKYGIVAITRDEVLNAEDLHILHFIGYETEPTFQTYIDAYDELATDPEFNEVSNVNDIMLLPASEDMIEHFSKELRVIEGERK